MLPTVKVGPSGEDVDVNGQGHSVDVAFPRGHHKDESAHAEALLEI